MSTRGGTLRRSVRVVWSRLDSGTVAVGTRGTLASLGSIARLAECVTMAVCALFEGARDLGSACFASVTGVLGKCPFSPLVKLASGCSVTSRICCTVRSKRRFLIVQAYLMSAMTTPDFVALATDALCVPFLVTFTMVKGRIGVGIPGIGCGASITCFLGKWSTRPWRCGHVRVTRLQGSDLRCIHVAFL